MLTSLSATVLGALSTLHGWPLYLVVALLAFGEAAAFIGLVLPGESAVFLGGALVALAHSSPLPMIAVVALAAIAGDSVGYQVGRALGPRMRSSRPGRWIGTARWDRAQTSMRAGGWWTVALGRWVGLLRALVPAVAGASHMPYRRFLTANATGGATWAAVVVLLGYGAGAQWRQAQGHLLTICLPAGAAVAAVVAARTWRAHHRRTSAARKNLDPASPQARHDAGHHRPLEASTTARGA